MNKFNFILIPAITLVLTGILFKWFFPCCCICPPKQYEYKIIYGAEITLINAVNALQDSVNFYVNKNVGWELYTTVGGGARQVGLPTNLEEIPGSICPSCEAFVTAVLRRPK